MNGTVNKLTQSGIILLIMLMAGGCGLFPANSNTAGMDIDIPYAKHMLANGLTLLVHEDHKSPVVAFNVWYHVGSKNEKPGKTGFAHLFEHLMFNGSEHYNDDYFKPMKDIGATGLNGTTSNDRTNYFETVPTSALETVLFLESDRMGFMTGAIDQAKLDEQRGVVQNEKRQYANRPYGSSWELITENTYPADHPYSWTVIGSMDDLNTASLEDVHEWFGAYYGAANAAICIAGDVDTKEIIEKVEKYFGNIPSGPPVARQKTWIAKMKGTHRQKTQDRVNQKMMTMVWNIPQYSARDTTYLELIASMLGQGNASRLNKRLVRDDQLATSIRTEVSDREIGGQFTVRVMLKNNADASKIENIVHQEINCFIQHGLSSEGLQIAKKSYETGFLHGFEQVGGFGGKANTLLKNLTYAGDADFYKKKLAWSNAASNKDLQTAAKRWLTDGVYILEIEPFGKHSISNDDIDRSELPKPGKIPHVKSPICQQVTLSNGLDLIVIPENSVPLIEVSLILDAGFASDKYASAGCASMVMAMLKEGSTSRSAIDITCDLSMLGARLKTDTSFDSSSINMSTTSQGLDKSLDIFADMILNPAFGEEDFKRLQASRLMTISREKVNPRKTIMRLIGRLLYGKGHIYDTPLTGSGTTDSITMLTIEGLKNYHKAWFNPKNATFIIAGDTDIKTIKPKLEKLFANWQGANTPKKVNAIVEHRQKSTIYLIDRPDSQQSVISTEQLVPSADKSDRIPLAMAVEVFGGSFTSRLNMNLREDKHWAYGARSRITDTTGQRPLYASTSVQTDKTAQTISEIFREYKEITTSRPPTSEELTKTQKGIILGMTGWWQTNHSAMEIISGLVKHSRPLDYFDSYPDMVSSQTTENLADAAKKYFRPDALIWIVIGDLEKIEQDIRQLDIAEVIIIDAEGNEAR